MPTHTTQSIVKAFDLMQIVCGLPRSASLRDVAAEARLSLATTHRILATLKCVGAVRVAADGGYELGGKISGLRARDLAEAAEARAAIEARLQALARACGMGVRLSVLDDSDMLCFVAGADAATGASGGSRRVGGRYEAYFHAAGKLLLAQLDRARLADYLGGAPLVAVTGRTITEPKRLAAELRHAAAVGYAVEDGEFMADEQAFAVPLHDGSLAIAALSACRASAPLRDVGEILAALRSCGKRIERDLADRPRGVRTIPWLADLLD